MKALIASLAALGLIAAPSFALTTKTPAAKTSTKTMVTKGAKSTATTTVTTKITPNKGSKHTMAMNHHSMKHHAMAKKMPKKSTASSEKTSG
jgi:hypothetical protein